MNKKEIEKALNSASKEIPRDLEKRKKLESFIHPAIYDEFFTQVNEIAGKNPDAIIQIVVPLLIELNLQYMFDKLLVEHFRGGTGSASGKEGRNQ